MLPKAVIVCLGIALAETGQGILRVRWLNRRVGDHRARQIGVALASGIILLIAWFTVPWIAPGSTSQALTVGGLWLVCFIGVYVWQVQRARTRRR